MAKYLRRFKKAISPLWRYATAVDPRYEGGILERAPLGHLVSLRGRFRIGVGAVGGFFLWSSFVFVVGAPGDDAVVGQRVLQRLGFVPRAYITVGSSDKSPVPACRKLSATPLVAEEAQPTASSGLIATKCHDRRFLMFTLLYPLLAISSFCLPLCFAFCVPLATLPLFRFSLPGVDLFDHLLFDWRLGSFHRLWR